MTRFLTPKPSSEGNAIPIKRNREPDHLVRARSTSLVIVPQFQDHKRSQSILTLAMIAGRLKMKLA